MQSQSSDSIREKAVKRGVGAREHGVKEKPGDVMKYVFSWVRLVAFAIVSLTLISCQKSTSRLSNISLPNASTFGVSTTTDYPGVVQVLSPSGALCTGTIISPKAVLTAAHCTQSAGRYSIRGSVSTSTTVRVSFGPGVTDDPNDIAILVFPNNTFSASLVYEIADSIGAGEVARLVGYGCNDLDTRMGSGTKRTGTNVVADINDYVEFYTPVASAGVRGILGPQNRAASCYGDSGGPAFKEVNGQMKIAAVTHAGGTYEDTIISQYVDVANRSDNRNFISQVNRTYNLGIAGF